MTALNKSPDVSTKPDAVKKGVAVIVQLSPYFNSNQKIIQRIHLSLKENIMSNQRVVVVTGVSSGIGRVTAARFVAKNCRVYGTVRSKKDVKPIAGVTYVEMDVRDSASIEQAIQSIIRQSSRIDVLVNNAGISLVGAIEETSIEEARTLFDVNVFGILRMTKAVLPHMRSQGTGRIVNISSVLGFLPAPYMGLYAASKHAVEGMSETLDHEVRNFGIRVVLVEPAYTKTKLDLSAPHAQSEIDAYRNDRKIVAQAIARNVNNAPEPDEVANTVVEAALGTWKMRRSPKGQASLLPKLRRFMPAGPVDSAIRKGLDLQ